MANMFDVGIKATAYGVDEINKMDQSVKRLDINAQKANKSLEGGGKRAEEGLSPANDVLKKINISAKDGAQSIGDMSSPLKGVGELALKYKSMLGGVGIVGAIFGVGNQLINNSNANAADVANYTTLAMNNNMDPHDFSKLVGAMRVTGIDKDKAESSSSKFYALFNDSLQGRDPNALAIFNQMGVKIAKDDKGLADVTKTLHNFASKFEKLDGPVQSTVANKLGFDENQLQFLRKGTQIEELVQKAQNYNLVDDKSYIDESLKYNAINTEYKAMSDGFFSKFSRETDKFVMSLSGAAKETLIDMDKNGPGNYIKSYNEMMLNNQEGLVLANNILGKQNQTESVSAEMVEPPAWIKSIQDYFRGDDDKRQLTEVKITIDKGSESESITVPQGGTVTTSMNFN